MRLVCKHDPKNPDHLICEFKRSPLAEWLARRRALHYCVGPDCPPRKAYGHLIADAILIMIVIGLVIGNLFLLASGRGSAQQLTIEERAAALRRLPVSVLQQKEDVLPIEAEGKLILSAQARYFSLEGEQLGRGSFPPKAGESTIYRVALKVSSDGESFENVIVEGVLPDNVEWTGFVPQGREVKFEEVSRLVRWQIGAVANVPVVAVIELVFNPELNQIGKRGLLIAQIVAYGRGQASQKEHSVYFSELLTEEVIHK